tara:strand:+ start:412 stop:747 length:336 start_codon:yes stop_codon:yes gene_type:complete
MITSTTINLSGTGDSAGNGTYDSGTSNPKINPIKSGTYAFLASGTFSSGTTLTLQHLVGDSYVGLGPDAVLTSAGGCTFTTSQTQLRLVVSNRTGTSAKNENLYVAISPIG